MTFSRYFFFIGHMQAHSQKSPTSLEQIVMQIDYIGGALDFHFIYEINCLKYV